MDKKSISMILIIIVLLIIVGFLVSGFVNKESKDLKVGKEYFILPDGYHVTGLNNAKDIGISNNTNTIYIANYNNSNVNEYINAYKVGIQKENQSISLENLTINNTKIYKSTVAETGINHYWFIKNNTTYCIYTWDKHSNIENIALELIESMHSN